MHELVRQYCGGMLEGAEEMAGDGEGQWVRDRHAKYYAAFLSDLQHGPQGPMDVEALESILEEMGNIHAAWDWAVGRGNVDVLDKCVDSLYAVGLRRGWQHEAMQWLGQAVAMLQEQTSATPSVEPDALGRQRVLLLGRLLCRQGHLTLFFEGVSEGAVALCEESIALLQGLAPDPRQQKAISFAKARLGWFLEIRGEVTRSEKMVGEALTHAVEAGDDWSRGFALWILSGIPLTAGNFADAAGHLRQSIEIFDRLGDQWMKGWCLGNLRFALWAMGEYEEAERVAQQEVRIRRELQDPQGIDYALLRLADAEVAVGKFHEARQHYREALAMGDVYGNTLMRYLFPLGMGTVAAAEGAYAEAAQLLGEAIPVAYEFGDHKRPLMALVTLGHAVSALGQRQRAVNSFRRALKESMEASFIPVVLGALVGIAHLWAREGMQADAAELLSLALHHRATYHEDRVRAQQLLTDLESELSAEAFGEAMVRGQARELEEVVAEVLGEGV
jgi:tetratricopeptide (TPR) repeat protein